MPSACVPGSYGNPTPRGNRPDTGTNDQKASSTCQPKLSSSRTWIVLGGFGDRPLKHRAPALSRTLELYAASPDSAPFPNGAQAPNREIRWTCAPHWDLAPTGLGSALEAGRPTDDQSSQANSRWEPGCTLKLIGQDKPRRRQKPSSYSSSPAGSVISSI